MTTDIYRLVPIEQIAPSATNPRKSFPEEYLAELAQSIRDRGIIQPLLVRTVPLAVRFTKEPIEYDLIAGECRLRAAKIAELAAVPVLVRDDLSDEDVMELQLIENLQRRDLDVLEEAESYAALMALEWEGKKRHTVESLAAALGKNVFYIHHRLVLLKLPEAGRAALRDGSLSFSVARMLGRVPTEKLRAQALEEVLHQKYSPDPMTARETAAHLRQNYMVDLKGSPFDKKSATLVPVEEVDGQRIRGGACTDCPFLSGNSPEFEDVGSEEVKNPSLGAPNVCTHPECYQAKMDASWEDVRMAALKEGKRVFSEAESEKVINKYGPGLNWNTPYVLLTDKVPASELSPEVVKPPTWKKLIGGVEVKPEIIVVRDSGGRPLEVVDLRQAVAAIRLSAKTKGESCPLKGGKIAGTDDDSSAAKQRAEEREKTKLHLATVQEAMTELREEIVQKAFVSRDFWACMLNLAFKHADADGIWLVAKWLGVESGKSEHHSGRDYESALRKEFAKLPWEEIRALVVILLMGQQLKWMISAHSSLDFPENFKTFAALYEIDLAALKKRVKAAVSAEIKDAKKQKQEKAKKAGKVIAAEEVE